MKKNKGQLYLISLIVLLASYVFIFEYQKPQQEAKKKEADSQLVTLKVDQVHQLSFLQGENKIKLIRKEGGWSFAEPFVEVADNGAVEDFIQSISTEKYLDVVSQPENQKPDLKTFGLDEPFGRIVLESQSGEKNEFNVSEKKNFEGNLFLSKGGESQVFIVNSTWLSLVQRKTNDFRDRRLFRGLIGGVQEIQVKNPEGEFKLISSEGKWSWEKDPGAAIDQNRVREILTQINEARYEEFMSHGAPTAEERKRWGLAQPRIELTLKTQDKTHQIQIGYGEEKKVFVAMSEPQTTASLAPSVAEKFLKIDTTSIRDRKLAFDFNSTKVDKIKYTGSLKQNTFDKTAPGYSDFLKILKEMEVSQFAEGLALKKGLHDFKLFDQEGALVFELQIGETRTVRGVSYLLARTNLQKEVFLLDAQALARIQGHSFFKEKEQEQEAKQ